MRKRRKKKKLPERNADAERFLRIIEFRKKQEEELRAMDKSFEAEFTYTDDPRDEFFYMTIGI